MKLYYKAGACSLATHITLIELGYDFDLEEVDLKSKQTTHGIDYFSINPQGYVPALDVGNAILTETPAILQYLADQKPDAGLAPPSGTIERAHLQAFLSFIASELHKAFTPFFLNPNMDENTQKALLSKLYHRMGHIENTLSDDRPHLMGKAFTVADTYCFVVCRWSDMIGVGLDRWPHIKSYIDHVDKRPSVRKALDQEARAFVK